MMLVAGAVYERFNHIFEMLDEAMDLADDTESTPFNVDRVQFLMASASQVSTHNNTTPHKSQVSKHTAAKREDTSVEWDCVVRQAAVPSLPRAVRRSTLTCGSVLCQEINILNLIVKHLADAVERALMPPEPRDEVARRTCCALAFAMSGANVGWCAAIRSGSVCSERCAVDNGRHLCEKGPELSRSTTL